MSHTVLLVEDVIVNRTILAAMLDHEGYRVLEAENAEEARRLLDTEAIDLLLLDVMLPGPTDGFALCESIKSNPQYADLPVIFLTALDDTASKVRGFEAGAADYVTKPFKREEVLARVRTQLRIHQLTQSLGDANRELVEKQEQLEADLRSAALVQQTFLPSKDIGVPGLRVEWRFTPSRHIGGDIFNVTLLPNGWSAVYLVDVSGHGVPPALVTIAVAQTIQQELRAEVANESRRPSPSQMIRTLERQFPMNRFNRYFTISLMMIETSTGEMVYSNAGHPPPILVSGSRTTLLEAGGPPVGMGFRPEGDEEERHLEPGSRLYFYTDGWIEQMDEQRAPYGLERLQSVTKSMTERSLGSACDELISDLDRFRGSAELDDDLALLALEFAAG